MSFAMNVTSALPARRRLMAAALAAAFAAASLVSASPVAAFGGDGLRAEANKYRTAGGLQPVGGTAVLDDIATARASQMVAANKLEHDLTYVKNRLNQTGTCWTGVGEILAWERGYPDYSYSRTMKQWWNSPGHKAIMMGSAYNAAGGAWARHADGGHYSVMIFVTLCQAPATVSQPTGLDVKMPYSPDRYVRVLAGTHTGLKLASDGRVLGSKSFTLGRDSSAPTSGRSWVNGKAYYLISAGIWAGYWLPEGGRSYVQGVAWSSEYHPEMRLVFAPGTFVGYRYDALGRVTAQKAFRLSRSSTTLTGGVACINGMRHFYVTAGVWDGYWVPDTSGVWTQ